MRTWESIDVQVARKTLQRNMDISWVLISKCTAEQIVGESARSQRKSLRGS